MNEKYFISIDLGTQGTKTAVIDLNGNFISSAFVDAVFKQEKSGAIEQKAEDIYKGVTNTIRLAIEKSKIKSNSIAAVSVVGQMAGIVGIDKNWNPTTPYDTGLDNRCSSVIPAMKLLGEDLVIRESGCPIIVAQGAKMYWWKTNYPHLYKQTEKFICASTYVCGKMAGLKSDEAYIDYTHIHLTGFADIQNNQWSDELVALFDFDKNKLPTIVSPWNIVGKVTKECAEITGLQEGIPIVAGCGDTAASSFGAGLVHNDMVLDVAGTASVLTACVNKYSPDVTDKALIFPRSVLPELWTPFSFVLGGQALDWYCEQVNYSGNCSFKELDKEAAAAQNDSLFFIPYFAGRPCPSNPDYTGHWIGMKFYHSRGNMFRSIMESVAYEYRYYLTRIKELIPSLKADCIFTSAGGAKSAVFSQIKSDVLGLPIVALKQKDTSHKAAVIIAGYGVGIYDDMTNALLKMKEAECDIITNPNMERHKHYNNKYIKYQLIVEHMEKLHGQLVL